MNRQLDLLNELTKNKIYNDLKLNEILEISRENYKTIIISNNERQKFIKWRQSIVAKELFEELNKNNTKKKHKEENKLREAFIAEMRKGLL